MQAWEEFLRRQEEELGIETVKKWLRALRIIRFDACNLYLEAKDSFQALWFEEHIRSKVTATLVNNNHKKIRVHISIGTKAAAGKPLSSQGKRPSHPTPSFQLNFDLIDPLCSFENFVVKEENKLSFYTLKDSLDTYNPIYLYGTSGCGKTHLLMALAAELNKKGKKAIYTRAETFTDHVVSAIRSSEMARFRHSYRNVDAILLDNAHVLGRKGATQEEFFHTFNALHLMGKHIIIAAKCHPGELEEIEPRLVSRFEWGIALPLEISEGKELEEILFQKAKALGYPLAPKIAEFLIESFPSGPKSVVRALEALILRSHVEQNEKISFRPLTVQLANHYLSDLILAEKQHALTPEKIIQHCAEQYGIKPEDILGKAQTRECAQPRQIAMYLCRDKLKLPFTKIGEIFGRDHSTVISSVRLIKKIFECRESEVSSIIGAIEKKFKPI